MCEEILVGWSCRCASQVPSLPVDQQSICSILWFPEILPINMQRNLDTNFYFPFFYPQQQSERIRNRAPTTINNAPHISCNTPLAFFLSELLEALTRSGARYARWFSAFPGWDNESMFLRYQKANERVFSPTLSSMRSYHAALTPEMKDMRN